MSSYDIKRFRAENDLTQSNLAEILGVTQAYMSDVEKGKKPLSKDAEKILTERFSNFADYEIHETNKNDLVVELVEVVKLQQMSITKRDDQIDRLITLLEKQLNK